jgi:hypothetical protein
VLDDMEAEWLTGGEPEPPPSIVDESDDWLAGA